MFTFARRPFIHALSLLAAGALGLASLSARAEPGFPSKPVKLIVPFAAGGSTDLVARVVAEQMRKELGQMLVVDNRAGAGGLLGTEAIASAEPDGYTIGMATVSTMAVNPIFFDKAAAVNRQLLPLVGLVSIPAVLTTHPGFPAKDFAAFTAELKRKPEGTNTAVPGVGSLGHLFVEAFADAVGAKILPVPYRGMGSAQTDAIAGTIPWLFDQAPSVMAHVKAGTLKPLAVAADKRLPELPQVPTLKELGHADLNDLGQSWFGLVVPAKTPPAVADKLRQAAVKALQSPDVVARLQQMNATVTGTPTPAFQAQIDTQLARNRAIAKRADIKVE